MKTTWTKNFLSFILASVFFLYAFRLTSQNEGNNWHFGNHAGISFNSGSAVFTTSSYVGSYTAGATDEGVASISNASGQTLFYTDGLTVYCSDNSVMANGAGLLGSSSSTQSAIIVPKPGTTDQYFIFTSDAFSGSNTIKYNLVDMSLNGGLGGIIAGKKNLNMPYALTSPSAFAEKLTAVPKPGGVGYWLLAHQSNETGSTGTFIVWEIGCSSANDGVNEFLVAGARQSVGSPTTAVYANELGYMKVSPDYTMIAAAHLGANFGEVFSFDNATGIISNPRKVTAATLGSSCKPYGVEFSPDNHYLFIGDLYNGPKIMRYDLSQSNLDISSSCTVYTAASTGVQYGGWLGGYTLGALQYAPDGKIYGALPGRDHLLSITNPNAATPVITENAFALTGGAYVAAGLPNFVPSYWTNVLIAAAAGSSCSATVSCSTPGTSGATYNWNFGDGSAASGLQNPSHVYPADGTYTITLTVTDAGGCSNTTETTVTVSIPAPLAVNSATVCAGQPATLTANGALGYTWNDGSTNSSITVSPVVTTIYTVTSIGACPVSQTATVAVNQAPVLTVNSAAVCAGGTVSLTASSTVANYLWSTAATSASISVSPAASSSYTVSSTGANGCSASAIATVTVNDLPVVTVNSPAICSGMTATLTASGATNYSWSGGQTGSTITVSPVANTNYTVTGTDNNGCISSATASISIAATGSFVDLGPDTIICNGQTSTGLLLDAGPMAGATYTWSTGDTTQMLLVTAPDMYWVEVSNGACSDKDTVTITLFDGIELGTDILLCTQEEVTLTPQLARNVPTTYLWSTGETSAFITVTGPGEYIVEAIQGNCVLIDSLEVKGSISGGALYVPNTFTPGPDYLNDIFYAEGEAILEFHMQIFDRWGERIFESYKQSEGWDGTYKGKPVPLDTYVWIIDYASDCNGETTMRKSGTVTALR